MHIKGGSIEMTGRRSIDQTMISEYSKSRMDLANKKAYIDQEISLQDYLYAQSANIEYYEFPDVDDDATMLNSLASTT